MKCFKPKYTLSSHTSVLPSFIYCSFPSTTISHTSRYFLLLAFPLGGASGGSGVRGSLLSDCRRTAACTMPSKNHMKRSSSLNSEPLRNRQEKAAIYYIVAQLRNNWDENALARKYRSWESMMRSRNRQRYFTVTVSRSGGNLSTQEVAQFSFGHTAEDCLKKIDHREELQLYISLFYVQRL